MICSTQARLGILFEKKMIGLAAGNIIVEKIYLNVLLFSFGIDSNFTYSTKCMHSDNPNMQCLKITIYFSYFLKFFCNFLKLTLWTVLKHLDVL